MAPVHPQYVVATTTCPHFSALSLTHPRLHVPVPPEIPEVSEEVHQPELHHQVSNLLAAQVLGFFNVVAEVPYHYVILVP